MTISEVKNELNKLGFDEGVINRYEEPHRYYHTIKHIIHVLDYLQKRIGVTKELFLATIYHDAIYNPKLNNNEEESANLFLLESKSSKLSDTEKTEITNLILSTKTHQAKTEIEKLFIEADLSIFQSKLSDLMEYEHQIFKEFQFVDYSIYKSERVKVLEKFNSAHNLDALIEYVKFRKPLIGVFAGSFNPFHKGHFNVLEKAEKIVDKVIIAFGKNPEKTERTWPIPKVIDNRQQLEYTGLLTDFVSSLGYPVVVVRGLRNSTDFQYEQNQYRYIQELMPSIKIVNVFCDKEYEHISSSGIRTLEKFSKHKNYLLD